jgi:hypothetical protein
MPGWISATGIGGGAAWTGEADTNEATTRAGSNPTDDAMREATPVPPGPTGRRAARRGSGRNPWLEGRFDTGRVLPAGRRAGPHPGAVHAFLPG